LLKFEKVARTENLSPELRWMIADLAVNEEEARKLMAGLDQRQFNWQPREGKGWSILQCVEHLTVANELYRRAMVPVVERRDAGAAGAVEGSGSAGDPACIERGSREGPGGLAGEP
jgi:hypothetical protein